ncbi:MAG: hypothetical protein IJE97_11710, partial [Thermoguttaceae bacterium]|nr:hypothetical protein [Thermoguttaceae bacterium]
MPDAKFSRRAQKTKRVFAGKKNFFGNFSKLPLALLGSWGIFLPVAGDEPDDDKRDSKLNESSLKSRRAARV